MTHLHSIDNENIFGGRGSRTYGPMSIGFTFSTYKQRISRRERIELFNCSNGYSSGSPKYPDA